MRVRLFLLVGLLLGGCQRAGSPVKVALPTTPEEAFAELTRAARQGDGGRLYALLDNDSRWSLMSIQRDQREICAIVRSTYPKEHQERELARCRQAAMAKDVEAYFVSYAAGQRLLAPLAALGKMGRRSGSGARVEIEAERGRVAVCEEQRKEDGRELRGWVYCGLRPQLEAAKIKAARDLTSVRENAESYKGR
jgi:hypothetical protein